MKYLLTLIITVLLNLTAFCQIIDLPEQTKKDIVITLESYPIILHELDIANALIVSQKSIIEHLNNQINQQSILINNKDLQIDNLIEQKDEYRKEARRLKSKNTFTIITAGIIGIVLVSL